jgi:cholesterol oxidase
MNTKNRDYDYIIIGSGFGGSVSALRLSEKGYKVLVIEKGKWYGSDDFAKTNWNIRKWLWIPFLRCFGIMKISLFRHVSVISGTGVGGGSLVYGNTLPIPKPTFYSSGSWAGLKNWEIDLKPHYATALKMLGAAKNPKLFSGDFELQELAKNLNKEDQFDRTNVSIYFGEENETVEDPYFNGDGPDRTACNFCGACMTGCRNNSKNTLDKNYLYLAQKKGAKILAEHEVKNVTPINSDGEPKGYTVHLKSSTKYFKKRQVITSNGVIFSGGVIGTVKLLLKIKKKSLPLISNMLGHDIRTNNETLVSVSSMDSSKDLSQGIAIGSILKTDENSHVEIVRYGKGSGFWRLFYTPYAEGKNIFIRILNMCKTFFNAPFRYLKLYLTKSWSKSTIVLLFMQSVDTTISIKKSIFGGMKTMIGKGQKPSPNIPESKFITEKYRTIMDGEATSFVLETFAGIPSTAHILGGAVMGENNTDGVIDKNNQVFGYPNMYIIDGSMISANPGVNPSLSITAIAEHAMSQIISKPN